MPQILFQTWLFNQCQSFLSRSRPPETEAPEVLGCPGLFLLVECCLVTNCARCEKSTVGSISWKYAIDTCPQSKHQIHPSMSKTLSWQSGSLSNCGYPRLLSSTSWLASGRISWHCAGNSSNRLSLASRLNLELSNSFRRSWAELSGERPEKCRGACGPGAAQAIRSVLVENVPKDLGTGSKR